MVKFISAACAIWVRNVITNVLFQLFCFLDDFIFVKKIESCAAVLVLCKRTLLVWLFQNFLALFLNTKCFWSLSWKLLWDLNLIFLLGLWFFNYVHQIISTYIKKWSFRATLIYFDPVSELIWQWALILRKGTTRA